MDGSTSQKVSLLVLVTSAAAVRIDASKAPTGSWDRAAFLSGFQNAAEIPAHQVRCAELPSDLVGTYYRNGASWIASPAHNGASYLPRPPSSLCGASPCDAPMPPHAESPIPSLHVAAPARMHHRDVPP